MPIVSVTFGTPGQNGMTPRRVSITSTDDLTTVTEAGYLNNRYLMPNQIMPTDIVDMTYSFSKALGTGTYQELLPVFNNGVISLEQNVSEGNVTFPVVDGHFAVFDSTLGVIKDDGFLPSNAAKTTVAMMNGGVIVDHIACFTDTAGTLDNAAATAINSGNLQAGLSGTAGYLASFPSTASKGSLRVTAIDNTGDTVTTISNAAMGQASTVSIPDPGAATASFVLTASAASTQSISTGLSITGGANNVQTTGGGNLIAGSSGAAGSLFSYPATAAMGSLEVRGVDNAGNFDVTIANASHGQASVYSIPDAANAAGRFLVGATATPFTSGNFPVASGTGGLMVDSGLAASNIQNKTNIIAATTADIGGAGAGPISVVVAGLTAASVVVASIESSSNAVAVAKCNATATGFDITFTADPGAACLVNYVAFIAAQ